MSSEPPPPLPSFEEILPEDEGAGSGLVPEEHAALAPPPSPSIRAPALSPFEEKLARKAESKALSIAAGIALVVVAYVASPIAVGILLGALTAFVLQPLYEKIRLRTRRPRLAALACVGLSGFAIASTGWSVGYLLVTRGVFLATKLVASLGPGGPGRALVERLTARLAPLGIKGEEIPTKLRDAASRLVESAAGMVATVATGTFAALLGLLFLMLTTHFVLRHGTALAARMEDMLPLHPRHTRALVAEIRKVGRQVLLGTVVTGVAQGLLAFVGYELSGVPEAAFFGAVTAVASLLPGVGTLLVWVPAGLILLATGHGVAGAFLLVWGSLVVVGLSDYVIRPRFVGHGEMPSFLTFAALFGGVEVFGISGLLWGPLLVASAVAVLRIHATESEGRAARELADD
jgi:predicted PurR-regulated permease PerM